MGLQTRFQRRIIFTNQRRKMKYTEVIEFKIEPERKKAIKELAKMERRTLSNYLRKLFQETIDNYGNNRTKKQN